MRKIHATRKADRNATGAPIDPDAAEVQQLKSAADALAVSVARRSKRRSAHARPHDRPGKCGGADLSEAEIDPLARTLSGPFVIEQHSTRWRSARVSHLCLGGSFGRWESGIRACRRLAFHLARWWRDWAYGYQSHTAVAMNHCRSSVEPLPD